VARRAATAGRDQGAVQGFGGSVGSLASILGLVAGGLLYPHLGAHLFFLTAIAIALAAAVVWRLTGGNPPAAEA